MIVLSGVDDHGRRYALVDTEEPWGMSDIGGETRFEVFADQIGDGG
jgi:hypothetical protein